jgi:hypothetical protein
MSHSNPFRPESRPIADEDGESMDSIPWESLDTFGQSRDHRRWYMVAAVIVVVAIGISAMRNLGMSAPDPVPVTTAATAVAAAAQEDTAATVSTTTAPAPALVTEADLMAVEPHMRERSAAAFAEVAVVEYFTRFAEGIWTGVEFDRSRSTFVEYATAVDVVPVGQFSFDVLVAVSVLDAGADGAFIRRPVRAVSIVVDTAAGDLRPAALPSPGTLPFRQFDPPATDSVDPEGELLEAITRVAREYGEVRSVEYREHPAGGGSATVTIVDDGGIGWPMNLEVDPDGTVVGGRLPAQP